MRKFYASSLSLSLTHSQFARAAANAHLYANRPLSCFSYSPSCPALSFPALPWLMNQSHNVAVELFLVRRCALRIVMHSGTDDCY